MSNKFKYSKAYRSREKKRCHYCRHHGRDVKQNVKLKKDICKNCCRKKEVSYGA